MEHLLPKHKDLDLHSQHSHKKRDMQCVPATPDWEAGDIKIPGLAGQPEAGSVSSRVS